jgi:phage terminase large subunit-like protein
MRLLDELVNYSDGVISGNITSCKKHRWAALRFLSDLRRSETDPAFQFSFDEARAGQNPEPGERVGNDSGFLNWFRNFRHTEGALAGQFIEPHISQKFDAGNIYGWVHRSTGRRRFTKAYLQIARKNAKSQLLAGVGSYEAGVYLNRNGRGEKSQVYIGATKTEQSKIVYDLAWDMIRKSRFAKSFVQKNGRIIHVASNSIFKPLSEEDKETGDGLNVQCGIIDEYHAHKTSETYDVVETGTGSREEPLIFVITTAGPNLMCPCHRVEYDLVSKILNPDLNLEMDHYFADIYELDKNESCDDIKIGDRTIAPGELVDDIHDERCWEKANPIICSYEVGLSGLRKAAKDAFAAPEKMRNFLTKRMNVWVNLPEAGYMDLAKWSACFTKCVEIPVKTCILGLDLSSKLDLTSASFEFKYDKKYFVRSHAFIPSETLAEKMKTDKIPYDLWVKQGWISLIPGARIEYITVADYCLNLAELNGWKIIEVCIDPWGAAQITKYLEDKGLKVVEVVQGIKTLSEPTKNFKEEVYAGNICHDGNPVLSWSISNAIVDEVDRNRNIILNKKKSRQRIDPIASLINAHVRSMVFEKPRLPMILAV